MKLQHCIAFTLAGALIAAPASAFVVVDGELGLDKREAEMIRTVCQGPEPVCTFVHLPQIKAMAERAYLAGKKDALAQGCKGIGI